VRSLPQNLLQALLSRAPVRGKIIRQNVNILMPVR
jgi:hypothetical protein